MHKEEIAAFIGNSKTISYYCQNLDLNEIDWSDLWIIDFRHLYLDERENIWYLVTTFDQVPYLVRVLFARYGSDMIGVMYDIISSTDASVEDIICNEKHLVIVYVNGKTESIYIPWIHENTLWSYDSLMYYKYEGDDTRIYAR